MSTWVNRMLQSRRAALAVVLCLLMSVAHSGNPGEEPAIGTDSGIEGTALWGPVEPGPSRPGGSEEAPFRGSFVVFQGDKEVAMFASDSQGRFRLALPPGDYVIVPARNTPIPRPETQTTSVTVPAQGFAAVTIRLDTGMR